MKVAVDEPENGLRYQKKAYDGMHERMRFNVSSRVAPQEYRMTLVPAIHCEGQEFFCCPV